MAALGICESLLIALTDLKIISEEHVRDLLTDVATAHDEAATLSGTPDMNRAVEVIVRRILTWEPTAPSSYTQRASGRRGKKALH
jgi:hypothetical protein